MFLIFLFGGLRPPLPPFFCHLVKVKLVFIIFIRKAPPPATPVFSFGRLPLDGSHEPPVVRYDQREGSEEPPSGFADAERRIVSDRRYKLSICVKSENHSFRLVVHTATRRATSHTVPADTGLNTLYASVL